MLRVVMSQLAEMLIGRLRRECGVEIVDGLD